MAEAPQPKDQHPVVAPRPRICLAGSGGGHVRQLLDLAPAWAGYDHVFVTEDTDLGRSLALKSRTHFVPHVALGQGRLGAPLRMALAGIRNFVASGRIILRERPDLLITTGAGSVFFTMLWARLLGARIVLIEILRPVQWTLGLCQNRRAAGAS